MLHKEGRKFGLTDPEIDQIITMEKEHNYHAPYSLEDKFEHLHNIAEVILADEIVEDNEIKMLRKFAIEAGFDYSKIDGIIEVMIEGIKAGDCEKGCSESSKSSKISIALVISVLSFYRNCQEQKILNH
jgi:hypothetical protein